MSRRDAAAFVRGVRRYGRVDRLADIASEVGRALEEATPGQRISLWAALMDGCKAAVAAEQAEDAKVRQGGAGMVRGGGAGSGALSAAGACMLLLCPCMNDLNPVLMIKSSSAGCWPWLHTYCSSPHPLVTVPLFYC